MNIVPLSDANNLGKLKPMHMTLTLVDRSVPHPEGLLKDIPVKIGDHYIPADFVVLKLEDEPKDPLILGRSFLAIAAAVIDVKHGKFDLHLLDIIMHFKMEKQKRPTMRARHSKLIQHQRS